MTNQITWEKPDSSPNALHTAFTQTEAVEAVPRRLSLLTVSVGCTATALKSTFIGALSFLQEPRFDRP